MAFFALALLFEFLIVYSFQGFGLIDKSALIVNLQVFAFAISPLFQLLPLTVIVVLGYSWVYLTRYTAYGQARIEVSKKPLTRRELDRRRFKSWRRFSKRISQRLQIIKASFQRIRGISYVSNRLNLSRPTVRSAFTVLIVFLALSLLLFVVVYPDLIYNFAVSLYKGDPSFLDFVKGTTNWARGFGDALAGVFTGVAPGFYRSLASMGAFFTNSVARLDVASKYMLCQNVAAWASALVALVYGMYASSRRQKRR